MMGKPCTYSVRYIMYVISMMGKQCICTLYQWKTMHIVYVIYVRYINDGKTMHIVVI